MFCGIGCRLRSVFAWLAQPIVVQSSWSYHSEKWVISLWSQLLCVYIFREPFSLTLLIDMRFSSHKGRNLFFVKRGKHKNFCTNKQFGGANKQFGVFCDRQLSLQPNRTLSKMFQFTTRSQRFTCFGFVFFSYWCLQRLGYRTGDICCGNRWSWSGSFRRHGLCSLVPEKRSKCSSSSPLDLQGMWMMEKLHNLFAVLISTCTKKVCCYKSCAFLFSPRYTSHLQNLLWS